jgi:hypothetical protein
MVCCQATVVYVGCSAASGKEVRLHFLPQFEQLADAQQ